MADPLPLTPTQELRRAGRPLGAINYSGISLIAKEFKTQGVIWLHEMVKTYLQYRAEYDAMTEHQRNGGQLPDGTMLKFWIEALPYLSLKMSEKITRGMKPTRSKRTISRASIAALQKAEGRQ